jgi:hypothetical protein
MQAIPRVDSGISIIDDAVSGVLPAAAPMASVNPLQVWTAVGAYVWLVGVAAMLMYAAISYVRLIRRKDSVTTPFVYGFIKPKIHIPGGLLGEELRYVTIHEQTHINRRDYLVKPVAFALLCVHWFNPLAWVAFALLCADMEMSCDERVLREPGMSVKADYSQTLLSLSMNLRIPGASPLAFGEGGIKTRVKNVLNFKKSSRITIVAAVALAVVLTVGFAVNSESRLFPMTMDTAMREPHFAETVTAVYDRSVLVSVNADEDDDEAYDASQPPESAPRLALLGISTDVKMMSLKDRAVDKVVVEHAQFEQTARNELQNSEDVRALAKWLNALKLERKEFAAGQSPGDREDGEFWSVTVDGINGRSGLFGYGDYGNGACYALYNSEWYYVQNPSDPPMP